MSSREKRNPLRRVKRIEGPSFYLHPNGYRIIPEDRDWDARGLGGMTAEPKRTWTVKLRHSGRTVNNFYRLGEARVWCDEHPLPAWTEGGTSR